MPEPLTFYVFITYDNLIQNSLRIPIEFSTEYKKEIVSNDNIILTVSDDKNWPMGWMISNNNHLWLQKGWPEFAEHYVIKIGHLLLFDHQGRSNFHIRIFDRSSCEITDFPSTRSAALKSDNPIYSSSAGCSSLQQYRWYVPLTFCKRYLTCGKKRVDWMLQTPDGKNWGPIQCQVYKNGGTIYGKNWKRFCNVQHLVFGDVCTFELINEVEKVLKVTIVRAKLK